MVKCLLHGCDVGICGCEGSNPGFPKPKTQSLRDYCNEQTAKIDSWPEWKKNYLKTWMNTPKEWKMTALDFEELERVEVMLNITAKMLREILNRASMREQSKRQKSSSG